MRQTPKTISLDPDDERALFRAIFAHSEMGIAVVGSDLLIHLINAPAARLFGKPPEDLVEDSLGDLIPELSAWMKSGLPGGSRRIAVRCPLAIQGERKKHASVDISWEKLHCRDREALIALFLTPARIDDEKNPKQEESVRDSDDDELRLRSILDTTVEGIITINIEGIIEIFNKGAEKIFGYEAKEVIGKNVNLLMPPPYLENHDQYLRDYLRTGEKKIIGIGREVEGKRRDGSTFPAEISIGGVQLRGRKLFTGIIRDISERKRMEERILNAERLSAIGEAMTGLAHESRNALQRAQACLEMLKTHLKGNVTALELIQGLQTAQDDLHHVYEDVREYARPVKLNPQEAFVSDILQEAWQNVMGQYSDRDVNFTIQAKCKVLRCHVDRFAIRHVLQNLFENALAACSDPVNLTVICEGVSHAETSEVKILVVDNGPGIPEERHERIFEPFFTTKTQGTGLGLAISRRLIKAHGGSLRVANSSPDGTTFETIFPRRGHL